MAFILMNTQRLIKMTKQKLKPVISVRCTEDMNDIINYLSDRLLLNTSSVVRLSLATLYENEKNKENKA